MMNSNKNKRNRSRRQRGNPLVKLAMQPAYKGQPVIRLQIPSLNYIYTTTASTGVIAQVIQISAAIIVNWSTRFLTWDEYFVVGAEVEFRPVDNLPGIAMVWWDENNSSAPTITDCQERVCSRLPLNNANPKSVTTFKWVPKSTQDLQSYPTTNTAPVFAYLKLFTDNTNFGAPTTATKAMFAQVKLDVVFKGMRTY